MSEAMKEGNRVIAVGVERAKHEASLTVKQISGHGLSVEQELHFEMMRQRLLEDFRESLLPLKAK